MKVYVISIDWAQDGECDCAYGCGVQEVYADKEQALIAMNEMITREFQNNDMLKEYEIERTDTEFIAGEEGRFNEAHFCIWVSEREVQ